MLRAAEEEDAAGERARAVRAKRLKAAGAEVELWEEEEEEYEAPAPINTNLTYSGVVTERDDATGNLLIDCPAVADAFGGGAVIPEDRNDMGCRVGSVVVFKVSEVAGEWPPVAHSVIIQGFDGSVVGSAASRKKPSASQAAW